MPKDNLDEIEKKKKELQEELERIQNELDHSLDEVRADVSKNLHPAEFIKNHPLPVMGISVLAGFLAGHQKKSSHSSRKISTGNGFSSILWSELKKLATRKTVSAAMDYLDNFLSDKKDDTSAITNGAAKKKE